MKTMRCVYQGENIELYEYVPTLLCPVYYDFEPMTFVRRIRYLFDYLQKGHYRIYYLKVVDDLIGYCVIAPGGRRLKCSTSDDIIVGPYFIKKDERRKGYSKILINATLENCSYNYKRAFDWILKSNIPSIRTTEACGFSWYGELNVVGKMRKLVEMPNGKYTIYIKKNG